MINWKIFGSKRLWLNFKVLSWNSPGGLKKTTKKLNQDSWFPGLVLKPEYPQYEAEVLTTRPRRTVELR
jgi:hypothetical protein